MGQSVVGKNPFGKYHVCAMNDRVHYLRYCAEIVNVPSL